MTNNNTKPPKKARPAIKTAPPANKANTLMLEEQRGKSHERILTEIGLSPIGGALQTTRTFSKPITGELDITEAFHVLSEQAKKVQEGDLSQAEAMLIAQATSLNAIFHELARRGALNMGEYLNAAETYLRLAMKAQSQCRTTLQTLAEIKNPPVVYARQANVTTGPQQINNSMPSRCSELSTKIPSARAEDSTASGRAAPVKNS